MKHAKIIALVLLLFLPIVMVFVFDARYNAMITSMCVPEAENKLSSYTWTDPEGKEREKIVTTAFYRHIADYFGRQQGTSPSLLDEEAKQNYWLYQQIGVFNRTFAISMLASIVGASVAGTLLVQSYMNRRSVKA